MKICFPLSFECAVIPSNTPIHNAFYKLQMKLVEVLRLRIPRISRAKHCPLSLKKQQQGSRLSVFVYTEGTSQVFRRVLRVSTLTVVGRLAGRLYILVFKHLVYTVFAPTRQCYVFGVLQDRECCKNTIFVP